MARPRAARSESAQSPYGFGMVPDAAAPTIGAPGTSAYPHAGANPDTTSRSTIQSV